MERRHTFRPEVNYCKLVTFSEEVCDHGSTSTSHHKANKQRALCVVDGSSMCGQEGVV